MHAKSINLAWIVVKDLKKAVTFYREVMGLKLEEMHEEWGWAELEGHEGGMRLGIAQQQPDGEDPVLPGQNAVFTLTVDNIEQASKDLQKLGTLLVGKMQIVPGQVKLQSVRDLDGNLFQLVEDIRAASCSPNKSCCH